MELDGAADDHLWVAAAPLPPYRAGSIVQWLIDFWYAPKFFLSSLTYLRRLLDSWPPIRNRFLVWFWFWFCFTVLGLVFGLWSSLAAVTAFSAQLPGLETDLCGYARLVGGLPLPIVNS